MAAYKPRFEPGDIVRPIYSNVLGCRENGARWKSYFLGGRCFHVALILSYNDGINVCPCVELREFPKICFPERYFILADQEET